MDDYVGKQLGRYRLIEHIGSGGDANVFLGEHIYLNRKAAIKILKIAYTQENIEKVREEAQKIYDLHHPHIIRLHHFEVDPLNGRDVSYLVMDYAPYGSLSKHYPLGSKLPLATIISYVKPIAEALQYAHDRKVIHRDVKPANFLLGENEQILLSDFGIAIADHSTRTMPEQDIIGSPPYMAPEQFDGKARIASDQYALAVVIYEWLSGEPLFGGPSWRDYAYQHKFVAPTPLRQLGLEIPLSIDQIILKALDKNPKERFARVQDFVEDLEKAYRVYEEEIAVWLNEPEYTVDMLHSEDVQFVFLERSLADPEWYRNNGQGKIDSLHIKGEKEVDVDVVTKLTSLAMKAKSKAETAVSQEDIVAFENMFDLMISCNSPASRYPEVWTSLLKELTGRRAYVFVVKHEAVHMRLLEQWSTLSPIPNVDPWLPQSWSELGAFLSLHLPNEWKYSALLSLLDTPITSDDLKYDEMTNTEFVESFFRYLLAPQRYSAALRWFTRLVESGYIQNMQAVMELLLASPHLTTKERTDFLEINGKQLLLHFPDSLILLDQIRQYLQAFNISELDKFAMEEFLQSLNDLSQQLPLDIQQAINCWHKIVKFIAQPGLQRAKLETFADAISSLILEDHFSLIGVLAKTFISCLEDEFDLINITYTLSPILKEDTLKLLNNIAEIVGQGDPLRTSEIRFIPYIRFILEADKFYDFLHTDEEQFVQKFLDTLFQKTNSADFKKLHKFITKQEWPQRIFNRWNEYALNHIPNTVENISNRDIRQSTAIFSISWFFRSCRQAIKEQPTLPQTIIILISMLFYCLLIALSNVNSLEVFFQLPQIQSYSNISFIMREWIIIGILEIIPLFFGALLGPWAGSLVGGGSFALGAFISFHLNIGRLGNYPNSNLYFTHGYWLLSLYYAIIGFIAGLAFFRTKGSYKIPSNIFIVEIFGFLGAVLVFLLTLASLDIGFRASFRIEQIIPFLLTVFTFILFPLLLMVWEQLKGAYYYLWFGRN